MAAKTFLALCASALFVQIISAHCLCAPAPVPWPSCGAPASAPISCTPSCGAANYGNIVVSNSASGSGGNLGVIVSSPFGPCGVSVLSENDISGNLEASGNLPLLAAVSVEGLLPTSGSAGTAYSCGNGQVGISSDSLAAAGLSGANAAAASAYGPISCAHGACAAPAIPAAPCGCY